MPNDGIYLSNDTYQRFLGDTFEQDSRSTIADEWQKQATAAIPSMVADAQDRAQQAAQSQRDALADQFTASVPDLVAQHVATLTPPEAPQNSPSAAPLPEPSQSATVAPDTVPATESAGVVDTAAPPVPIPPAAPTVSPPATPPAPATGYEAVARAAAQKYGIDPDLFARQISQESGFNPNAISPAGARGIAQFMPDTAKGLGINPDDPEQALDGAARYMAQLIQHNGSDVSKALAAYNAGQGNVDKYGGIPPFEETKRYVAGIMGGAGQVAASVGDAIANSGAGRVVTAAVNNVIGALRPSQFGVGLSDAEAYAACGPVAAMAFARATGQNPTAEQAVALAKQLGWTPAQGMAGPGSELDLLKNMGVPAHMEQAADPAKIAQDVQNGNPVIISTPGHYFVADGYDPQKGFHVGSSGTDLKAGSEWMSLDQMQRVMGAAQATLYLDRKPGDGPSVASQMSQSAQPTDQVAASTSTPAQPQSMWDKLGSGISDVFKNIFGGVSIGNNGPGLQSATGEPASISQSQVNAARGGLVDASGAAVTRLAAVGGAMQPGMDTTTQGLQAANQFRAENFPSILDPNHPANISTDLLKKYGTILPTDAMTPEDRAKADSLMISVGGLVGPVGGKYDEFGVLKGFEPPNPKYYPGTLEPITPPTASAAPRPAAPQPVDLSNPFQLHAEPGPNRTPLTLDQAAQHLEDLNARHTANDGRIAQLEDQIAGGDLIKSTGVVRPPGTIGWTDAEVQAYAQLHGLSAYSTQGWGQQAGDAAYVAAHKPNVPNVAKQTPTQARAELAQLRAENEQIATAADHAIDNGNGPFYRAEGATTEALPWDYNAPGGTAAASTAAQESAGAVARGGISDTGAAPQGTRAAPPAGAPAAPAQPQLAPPYPSYPAPPPAPPAAAPQAADTTLQGLLGMAKARGIDTSAFEAQLPKSAIPEPTASPEPLSLKPVTAEPPPPIVPPEPPISPAEGELPGIPPSTPGKPSFAELFRAYHTGNVISGLSTMTHVAINSVLAPAWSFAARGSADILGGAAGLATGGRVGLDTGMSRVQGSMVGVGAALSTSGEAFAKALSEHFSSPNAIFNRLDNNPAAATFFKAQGVFPALHGAFQSLAQNAIMKMEVGRLAGEEATHLGLSGQAWTAHVANAIDNPSGPIAQAAEGVAKRASLRGDLGTLGSGFQTFVNNVPIVGNTLFPVLKIAANSLSQGIERSPLGLAGTAWDVGRAVVSKSGPYAGDAGFVGNGIVAPLSERLTNNIAGTALTAWLASKALDGSITGDGPGDPGQKAELMAQGWQPNSVYLPGRGYVDFHALGPLAVPFALAGAYGDAIKYGGPKGEATGDPEAIAGSMSKQMGKYLEDSTGLRTVGQLYDVFHTQGVGLQQAGRAATQFGANLVGGFVPESATVRGIASATDESARKAAPGDLGQALSMGIPGLRETVPVKQDVLGRPEANNLAGLGVFSPRTGTGTPDPVIKTLEDAGVRFPALPKQVAVSSKYAVDLTPDEQQQFQTLRGQFVQSLVSEIASDPDFAAAPLATRQKYLQRAFALADKNASQQLVSQIPDGDLVDRVMTNQARRAPVAFSTP